MRPAVTKQQAADRLPLLIQGRYWDRSCTNVTAHVAAHKNCAGTGTPIHVHDTLENVLAERPQISAAFMGTRIPPQRGNFVNASERPARRHQGLYFHSNVVPVVGFSNTTRVIRSTSTH